MKKYIVVAIGCTHCPEPSHIVGVFDSEEKANAIAEECTAKHDYRERGETDYEVFEMPELNVINPEFLNAAK